MLEMPNLFTVANLTLVDNPVDKPNIHNDWDCWRNATHALIKLSIPFYHPFQFPCPFLPVTFSSISSTLNISVPSYPTPLPHFQSPLLPEYTEFWTDKEILKIGRLLGNSSNSSLNTVRGQLVLWALLKLTLPNIVMKCYVKLKSLFRIKVLSSGKLRTKIHAH